MNVCAEVVTISRVDHRSGALETTQPAPFMSVPSRLKVELSSAVRPASWLN